MSGERAWWRQATPAQWRVLAAAMAGWMLDAMDVMLYAFALPTIRAEFGLSGAQAGALASVTLLASAAGGIAFGALADRIGRARALVLSILTYSLFTALTATAHSLPELVLWRTLVGLGLGGEWAAGSVLVAESWPAAHRGKAIGLMQSGWALGYILAALLSSAVLPTHGWRPLFALGLLPALVVVWIRRRVPEPDRFVPSTRTGGIPWAELARPPLLGRATVATLLTTLVLFAYWGLFTWVPAYLASPVASGGAGLSVVRSSAFIIPMQLGAWAGYVLFGVIADRWGRRSTFAAFVLAAAAVVPVYGQLARHPGLLLALGPLVGFAGHGYFSLFGAMLAELFPGRIRGTAQGLCYNLGRAISALAPATIGALADRHGIGSALVLTALFFAASAAVVRLLPETRGEELG
ncbi:MAG: MFS transporter [Thermoanaerobaculaceae bacterium]|nr:MFS transporter [Thermoanaerobaculaceae bacterium]MDI9623024.1 MFS transporter [Acidobacteriota bacterium]NLH12185.1 MFS transporter [Holophagae bacterium]HPW55003.1 MFS transporter [Thermoanaerobaculaceae bacterium]